MGNLYFIFLFIFPLSFISEITGAQAGSQTGMNTSKKSMHD